MATRVILPYLRAHGINRLDTLVISHGDNDHSAGTGHLLRALDVARIRYGGRARPGWAGRPCRAGESWRWPDGTVFRMLSPARERDLRSNDSSCVLQVSTGGYRFLLAGDIERTREAQLAAYWRDELAADWLLVPHHGSVTSSSHVLLKTVRPAVALVSAGYANSFGHPHPTVSRRLAQYGARTLDTASHGALELRLAPQRATVWQYYRDKPRPYWW